MADVFFDYTCGYSNRARHWLDALGGAELVWRPFSLLEQNAGDAGPAVFDRDEYVDNPSLIALAVHERVRAQDGDVDAYRQRMFTAWHEQPGRLLYASHAALRLSPASARAGQTARASAWRRGSDSAIG